MPVPIQAVNEALQVPLLAGLFGLELGVDLAEQAAQESGELQVRAVVVGTSLGVRERPHGVAHDAQGGTSARLTLDPATRPIPLIVCSAAIYSLHEHQEMLTKFGTRALPKPFDLDTLLQTIEDLLVGSRDARGS